MVLSQSLKKNNIILKPKSSNRWDLIEEMVSYAVKNKELAPQDSKVIKNALIDREKSMSTGIGNGVAIPHCATKIISDIVFIMAICSKGIDFDSIDSQPVKIVILLLVPKSKLTQHIKTLANIAKLLSSEQLRNKLLQLKTQESIIKALKNYEEKI